MGAVELVGRDAERRLLLEVLNDISDDKGRNVIINGEAGIGKSTLIEHLESEARKLGMMVCKGECTEIHRSHVD